MPEREPSDPDGGALVGSWDLVDASGCEDPYPHRLFLAPDGTYQGERDPPGTFTILDAGSWSVEEAHSLRISTATDEEVTFTFTLGEGGLKLVGQGGCELRYRPSAEEGPEA